MNPTDASYMYTITVMGPGGVGKSCLTIRLVSGSFVKKYDPTIEDNYKKQMEVDGRAVMLDIMDTAGQEEFTSLRGQYIASGQGFMLVFSVTSESSFLSVDHFHTDVLRTKDTNNFPIILIANKVDRPDKRKVSAEEAQKKAKNWGVKYIETSAKTNQNVLESFQELVRTIDEWRAKNPGKKGDRSDNSGGRAGKKKKRCILQ